MKFEVNYKTIERVAGPLVIVGKVGNAAYNEIVKVKLESGETRLGQVLETTSTYAVVQVFGPTEGIAIDSTSVSFLGETFHVGVSEDMLGRVFDGQGRPRDVKAERLIQGEEGHKRRADKPGIKVDAARLHRDRHLNHRRAQHAGKRAKAAALLGIRTSAQRTYGPDNKAGEGQGIEERHSQWCSQA